MSADGMTGNLGGRNWPRLGLIVAGVIVVIALGIYGYHQAGLGAQTRQSAPAQAAAISVKTAQVTQGPIASSISYSGNVTSISSVSVLPKTSGRITKLNVDVGSAVKTGDVIALLDDATQQAQVSQAAANVAAAEAKYASLQAGPRSEQVAQAQLAVDAAQARLDALNKGARSQQIAAAQAQVDSAKANVTAAQARLATVKKGPTETQWASALAAVDSARANMTAAAAKLSDVQAGPKQADVANAMAAIAAAQTNLLAKEDALDSAKNGTPQAAWAIVGTSVGEAYQAVAAAQAQYQAAVAALNLLQSNPLPVNLQAAQSALDVAKASLNAASAAVDDMKSSPKPEDVQAAQSAVDAAAGQQAAAEANLKLLQAPPTEEDVRQAQDAVNSAQQQLALVQSPYTTNDLNQAKAGVAQAQAALDQAKIGLGETSIVSPVDGVVSDKYQSVGQLVGPTSPIVNIVSQGVEMTLGVEESQIGQVAEGQKAEITVSAYPNVIFPAKVASISPTADPKSRTFQVKVRPEPADSRLKAGMFAQVRIITQQKANALLVPKDAVVTKSGQATVFVVKDGTAHAVPVKTGLSSGNNVEVTSGLSAGEEVVVAGQADLRDGDKVSATKS